MIRGAVQIHIDMKSNTNYYKKVNVTQNQQKDADFQT